MSEAYKKRSNYRSNSELMKNENSLNVCENEENNSCMSSENNKDENQNIKNVDKQIYSSNYHNNIDNSHDIAVLIKKKNMNFANNFLDSYNKNNINTFKSTLQNKAKHNSTHSSSHNKINSKTLKNNFFQTNRDNIALKTKNPIHSSDNHKKKG